MTKEEREKAIRILDGMHYLDDETCFENKALDEAIRLLKQKPCSDCISRQAVIDAFIDVSEIAVRSKKVSKEENERHLSRLIQWINSFSSVKPQEQEPKTDILDKIRSEIMGMYRVILKDTPEDDWAVRWNDCIDEVLQKIDSIRLESKVRENDKRRTYYLC